MELRTLRIENLRLIETLALHLAPRWNLFLGPNGAGKTTLLEAVYLLSHGRSFRTASKDVLVRRGSPGYAVYGELARAGVAGVARVGVARSGARVEARLDGAAVTTAELLRHTAVLCFEPGSHALISGASDERRALLDWGVFHVEHDFLATWRRYQRALKQRNALLRSGAAPAELDPWDHELASAAAPLCAMRERYFAAWRPLAVGLLEELLVELGPARLHFHPGFDPERSLAAVLAAQRVRDLARGHTGAGPHRADWTLSFAEATQREHLSRGQEKLCAFACVMAQARLFMERAGEWPILCLDDIASEIDADHRRRILDLIDRTGAQVLVTATQEPAAFAAVRAPIARFHVEQGRVTALL